MKIKALKDYTTGCTFVKKGDEYEVADEYGKMLIEVKLAVEVTDKKKSDAN